jgi:hypothetical protein
MHNFPVVYGCETWSHTLKNEHRLRMFKNWMLGRIFASKRAEVILDWRKLHNMKLNDLYCSADVIRVIK